MKDQFRQFYGITESDIDDLFKHAWFVLDTNVLLNPYETHEEGKQALFSILAKLRTRMWVPHHVALEFQRIRLKVIKRRLDESNKTQKRWCDAIDEIKKDLVALELHRRKIGVAEGHLCEELDALKGGLVDVMQKARKTLSVISLDDSTRDKIDKLFAGRVGPAPANQKEVDDVYAEGERRFTNNVPPGFHDVDKSDLSYVLDGIKYERQYGDLLIWKQTLAWAQATDKKALVFVTSDNKPDWWSKDGKAKIGPHPELRAEMARAGVDKFWMFQLPEFLEQASKRLNTKVSLEGINQVRDAVERSHSAGETPARFRSRPIPMMLASNRIHFLFQSAGYSLADESIDTHGWLVKDSQGIIVSVRLIYAHALREMHLLRGSIRMALDLAGPSGHDDIVAVVLRDVAPSSFTDEERDRAYDATRVWVSLFGLRGAMIICVGDLYAHVVASSGDTPTGQLYFAADSEHRFLIAPAYPRP